MLIVASFLSVSSLYFYRTYKYYLHKFTNSSCKRLAKGRQAMLKPLPLHNKHTAYIEISKSGFKFIGVLVDGDLRHSACMYDSLAKVKKFAKNNDLDYQLVGALA